MHIHHEHNVLDDLHVALSMPCDAVLTKEHILLDQWVWLAPTRSTGNRKRTVTRIISNKLLNKFVG